MLLPPVWTTAELEEQRLKAIASFRKTRVEEPLQEYVVHFDEYLGVVETLLESTIDLKDLKSQMVSVLTDRALLEAFRYLAGPPVSVDDLNVIAEARLSKKVLAHDADMVARVGQVVMSGLDRRRFPWVIEGREPTEIERQAAIVASAALMATRKMETRRRTEGKQGQEAAVHQALRELGFQQVPSRRINVLRDGPKQGEFCAESVLGTKKADVLVGLWDGRLMGLECKVSNSSTNSVKRLNGDAAIKAEYWRKDFGERHVVPAAVLGGVYKVHNLLDAQTRGLTLFWEHDLPSLTEWISKTRSE